MTTIALVKANTIHPRHKSRDPHLRYDYRLVVVIRGLHVELIILENSETDQYEGDRVRLRRPV